MKLSMVYGIPVLLVNRQGEFYLRHQNDEIEKIEIPQRLIKYYAELMIHTFIGVLDAPIRFIDDKDNLALKNLYYEINPWYDDTNKEWYIADKIFRVIKQDPNYFISDNGVVYSTKTNKLISQHVTDIGYHSISLHINGRKFNTTTQRLVYETWIGNIPEGMEINHIDSIPWRNVYSNLEPLTPLDNIRYAKEMGNRPEAWSSKEIHQICKYLQDGLRPYEILTEMNIGDRISIENFRSLCYYLKRGKKYWKDISAQYDFSSSYDGTRTHSIEQINQICKMISDGFRNKDISEKMNVSFKYVSAIRNGNYYPEIMAKYM